MNEFQWNGTFGSDVCFRFSQASFGKIQSQPNWCVALPSTRISQNDVIVVGDDIYLVGQHIPGKHAVFNFDLRDGSIKWIQSSLDGAYFGIFHDGRYLYVDGYILEPSTGEILHSYKELLCDIGASSDTLIWGAGGTALFEFDSDEWSCLATYSALNNTLVEHDTGFTDVRDFINGRYILGHSDCCVSLYDCETRCAVWSYEADSDISISANETDVFILSASGHFIKLHKLSGAVLLSRTLPLSLIYEQTIFCSLVQSPEILYITRRGPWSFTSIAFRTSDLNELWGIEQPKAAGSIISAGDLMFIVSDEEHEKNRMITIDRYSGEVLREDRLVIEPYVVKGASGKLIMHDCEGRLAAYGIEAIYDSPAKSLV